MKLSFFHNTQMQTTMNFQCHTNLQPYNTFGIAATCDHFTILEHPDQLSDIVRFLEHHPIPVLILGNGSNILFVHDFKGLVILNRIKGMEIVSETDNEIQIQAGAGENWRDFVSYCVSREWGGIENLADIPGTIGASAVQNIGAYNMEAGNTIINVTAYNLQTKEKQTFTNAECHFGYRFSIFKKPEYKHHIITHVTYRLNKTPLPVTSYKAIQTALSEKHISAPAIDDMYYIVKELRKNKLPDETILHNAGSFFKNPVVSAQQVQKIQQNHPDMPLFPLPNGYIKLSAGWLIEQCGLKGYRKDDAGIHDKQALVIVNYGTATGTQIMNIARLAIQAVQKKFEIHIEPEVIVI